MPILASLVDILGRRELYISLHRQILKETLYLWVNWSWKRIIYLSGVVLHNNCFKYRNDKNNQPKSDKIDQKFFLCNGGLDVGKLKCAGDVSY